MKREEKELFKSLCNFKTKNFDELLQKKRRVESLEKKMDQKFNWLL